MSRLQNEDVNALYRILRVAAATAASTMCGLVFVVVVGVIVPIGAMLLIYGRQEVDDAPGNGGIILFLTVPFAAMVAFIGVFPLTFFFYRKISKRA
ncbi:MAG TPA: hypothetical protein VFE29_06185 [Terriglobia bacterium]|nr:hypothetical protein [Terriglobia bacterium]